MRRGWPAKIERLPLASLHLSAAPGSSWAALLPAPDVSLMTVTQVGVVLLATFLAAVALHRARKVALRDGHAPWVAGWRLVGLGGAAYAVLTVALIL